MEAHLRRHLGWYVTACFVVFAVLRTAFVISSDGRVHEEMYWYLAESQFPGGLDGQKVYLGAPSLGVTGDRESWRIPSFLFYNLNYWLLQRVGVQGLLLFISWSGLLGLFVFYAFVRRLWATQVLAPFLALVVAGLVPYNTFLTTGVWNPNYLWLWVAAGLYCLLAMVQAERRAIAGIALCGVSASLCIAAQYHLTAYFQIPAVLVVLLAMRLDPARRRRMPPAWSFAVAALPWIALTAGYFYWDSRFGFANTRLVFSGMLGRKITTPFDNLNFLVGFASAGSSDISTFYHREMRTIFARYLGHAAIGYALVGVHFAVILYGMGRFATRLVQRVRADGWRLAIAQHFEIFALLAWVIVPVGVLTLTMKSFNTRYAVWMAPLAAVLQVWAFVGLARSAPAAATAPAAAARGGRARLAARPALRLAFGTSVGFMAYLAVALVHYNRTEFADGRRLTGPRVVALVRAMQARAPAAAAAGAVDATPPPRPAAGNDPGREIPRFVNLPFQTAEERRNTAELNRLLSSEFSRRYWRTLARASGRPAAVAGQYVLLARRRVSARDPALAGAWRLLVETAGLAVYVREPPPRRPAD